MPFALAMTAPATPTLALSAGRWILAATLLWPAAPGQAQPWGQPISTPPPVPSAAPVPTRQAPPPSRWAAAAPGPDTLYDNDPANWRQSEAERAQLCNVGRLVGGLLGGGVGYASSRKEGRSWAVPLGALLGSQVGCNVGAGRAPVPW